MSDVGVFPHGLGGLKIWESDVVASRYVLTKN